MATIQTFASDAPLEDIIEAVRKDGAVIVKDLLPPATIQEMNTLLQPYNDADDPDKGHTIPDSLDEAIEGDFFLKSRTHRIYGLLGKMPGPVSQVVQNPIWAAIMEAFLADKSTEWIGDVEIVQENSWQLALTQSFTILPGCDEQPHHRDQREFGFLSQSLPFITTDGAKLTHNF